jgi:hypothetical protein
MLIARQPRALPVLAAAVRWAARAGSIASTLLFAAMATDGPNLPTPAEAVALAMFPIGVVVGFAIAWRRETLGGFVSVASLAAFYLWMTALGRGPTGPWFLITTAPALLFIASGLLRRRT